MELPPILEPRQEAPPVLETRVFAAPPPEPEKPQNIFQKIWAWIVGVFAAVFKFLYPLLKLAKFGKVLLTLGSMAVSLAFYTREYGFWFALGFVVCILIHELGHVFAAWRLGLPVSAPIFIPFLGALILLKDNPRTAYEQAIVGIGGPFFGFLSAIGCFGLFFVTGVPIFLGLSFMAFFLNLFNMIPVYPLDGGRIAGAISPYIWILGLAGLIALEVMGLRSIFIWIIVLFALPNIWQALKRGTLDQPGKQTTTAQKAWVSVGYIGLCGLLAVGFATTAYLSVEVRRAGGRPMGQVVFRYGAAGLTNTKSAMPLATVKG